MKVNKGILAMVLLVHCLGICPECQNPLDHIDGSLFKNYFYDMAYVNIELFSVDTLKLLLAFGPAYIATRAVDDPLQLCFYCPETHTNCYQLPHCCHSGADKGAVAISVGLASLAFLPIEDHVRVTARVFMAGLIPIWLVKNIFKQCHFDGCLRPKNEFFDCSRRYYGGCPSGHMAFMMYATSLFGFQLGWKWGVPLGIASIGVFGASLNGNRHYLSQLIAGTGLGLAYGFAADKVVNDYFSEDFECEIVSEKSGSALQLSYSF